MQLVSCRKQPALQVVLLRKPEADAVLRKACRSEQLRKAIAKVTDTAARRDVP
ncbi:hypothetical protein BH10PSE6_BH10PSE6_24920 [soil metagenome]